MSKLAAYAAGVAVDHVAWAVRNGQSPMQIIMSVGAKIGWADVNGKDAERAVAEAWLKLKASKARKRGRKAA